MTIDVKFSANSFTSSRAWAFSWFTFAPFQSSIFRFGGLEHFASVSLSWSLTQKIYRYVQLFIKTGVFVMVISRILLFHVGSFTNCIRLLE